MRKIVIAIIVVCFSSLSQAQLFPDIAVSSGMVHQFNVGDFHFGGGAAVLDYDNDGWEDVYVTGGYQSEALFRNNGDGTFAEVHLAAGFGGMDTLLTQGVIAGDIDNDGYRDLYITVRCDTADLGTYTANRLFHNNGDGTFSDITGSAGMLLDSAFSTSASFGDANLDGYLDIYVINYLAGDFHDIYGGGAADFSGKPSYLYINNGDLTFTESAAAYMVADTGTGLAGTFTDFDNDHDMDVYVVNDFGWEVANALYENNYPAMNYSDITTSSGTGAEINGMGVAVGDYDRDGDMDYYVTNMLRNVFYENNGDGTFSDLADETGINNTYVTMDTNMACATYYPDTGFTGMDTVSVEFLDGGGTPFNTITFIFEVADTFVLSDSMIAADTFRVFLYNKMQANRCFFELDSSLNVLVPPSVGTMELHNKMYYETIGWGCNFFDFNNDGWPDLYVSNGILSPNSVNEMLENPNSLFMNNGDGTFTEISDSAGVQDVTMGRGSVVFDFDKDGKEDILEVNANYPDSFLLGYPKNINLFHNQDPVSNHFVRIKATGTNANRDGIGARVNVYAGGVKQIREIDGGSSFLSQNSIIAHVGLGSTMMVDSVEVYFPGGCRTVMMDVPADTMIELVEGVLYSSLPDTLMICEGASATLDPMTGSGYSYAWSSGETTESISVSPTMNTTYTLTATGLGGCPVMDSTVVMISPGPAVSFTGLDSAIELAGDYPTPEDSLTGVPPGGTFSGPGMVGNVFYPDSAGAGTWDIIYTYTDPMGCTASDTQSIIILPAGIEEDLGLSGMRLFPNPFETELSLAFEAESPGQLSITIMDMNGRLISHESADYAAGKQDMLLNIPPQLSIGTYFMHLENSNGKATFKLIKR